MQEDAARLLHDASDADLFPGHSVETFSAACVYAGAYLHHVPRTYDSVAEESVCQRNKIKQAHQCLTRAEDITVRRPAPDEWPRFGPLPWDLIPQLAAAVSVKLDTADVNGRVPRAELETHARARLRSALETDNTLGNRTAKGLAAGAVYDAGEYACLSVTQSMVAGVTPVSKGTVRNAADALQGALR